MKKTNQSRVLKLINAGISRPVDMCKNLPDLKQHQILSACNEVAKQGFCECRMVAPDKYEFFSYDINIKACLMSQVWDKNFKADWSHA